MKRIPVTFHTAQIENVNVFYRKAGLPKTLAIFLLCGLLALIES